MKPSPTPRSSYYTEKAALARTLALTPFTPTLIEKLEEDEWNKSDLRKLADRDSTWEYL
jgi:hypothetical protein